MAAKRKLTKKEFMTRLSHMLEEDLAVMPAPTRKARLNAAEQRLTAHLDSGATTRRIGESARIAHLAASRPEAL